MGTNKFIDLLRMTRLWHGRAYIAIAVLGFLLGKDHGAILPFTVSTLLYVSFAFAINNCFDVETDMNGEKRYCNPVADGSITFKEGVAFSALLAISGILVAEFLPTNAFITYIVSTLLALIYSAPPRAKTKPPFDLITHGLFFGSLLFLFGLFSSNGDVGKFVPLALSIFFYSCFLELRNHIEDYESDLASNTTTSAVWLGKETAERIKWIFYAFHVASLIPYYPLTLLALFGLLEERIADMLTVAIYLTVAFRLAEVIV
ncbi:UbiA prenyltransferase family protein [Archaeoglobus profundus]|uniref:UbiA prenyltransferase n=1 Tax=Archaeoglobus profundus (strain DSM 5631 / JCM 9629 / NBRC 100127 / Av18) TaxID=572546 RepID=D2RF71_ARCPA|nr:UbiA prenyltransferase family protein [Archaeoglobus profundus]ADB58765.1 UbiA prenyltransferase [Archaeoglobus profundus DSM 5631]